MSCVALQLPTFTGIYQRLEAMVLSSQPMHVAGLTSHLRRVAACDLPGILDRLLNAGWWLRTGSQLETHGPLSGFEGPVGRSRNRATPSAAIMTATSLTATAATPHLRRAPIGRGIRARRQATDFLKKASSAFRSEIAALKRRIATLESQVKKVARQLQRPSLSQQTTGEASSLRFSAAR